MLGAESAGAVDERAGTILSHAEAAVAAVIGRVGIRWSSAPFLSKDWRAVVIFGGRGVKLRHSQDRGVQLGGLFGCAIGKIKALEPPAQRQLIVHRREHRVVVRGRLNPAQDQQQAGEEADMDRKADRIPMDIVLHPCPNFGRGRLPRLATRLSLRSKREAPLAGSLANRSVGRISQWRRLSRDFVAVGHTLRAERLVWRLRRHQSDEVLAKQHHPRVAAARERRLPRPSPPRSNRCPPPWRRARWRSNGGGRSVKPPVSGRAVDIITPIMDCIYEAFKIQSESSDESYSLVPAFHRKIPTSFHFRASRITSRPTLPFVLDPSLGSL